MNRNEYKSTNCNLGDKVTVNKANTIKLIILVSIVLLSIYFIYHRQVNSQDQVNSQETKREILCVEYTINNVCKHGVDPELWTVVDHSANFGVIYFCQETGLSAPGERCFYLFSNQTSDTIKDKINKAFGVQIK